MLFAASAHGAEHALADSVKNGLAWFYLLCVLLNVGFAVYQRRVANRPGQFILWMIVAGVFLLHAIAYFAGADLLLPQSLRNLSDYGLSGKRLPIDPDTTALLSNVVGWLLILSIIGLVVDAVASYAFGGRAREAADRNGARVFRTSDTGKRMVIWLLLITVLALLLKGTDPVTYFVMSVVGLMAFIVWRKPLTEPTVAWGLLNAGLLFGGWSMTDTDFYHIVAKPDNVPIIGMIFIIAFFTWLAFRKAVINDERIAQGLPPAEKEEDEKVLVWPDLVYTELICMVVVTVVLIIWSVALPAPIEQPSSLTKTPNPSKAPWYFLGLQEMLVYYDPWMAGVVLPTFIIIGLMAIPYIDYNQKGNGYFSFAERKFAIFMFLFGFIVLWVTLIILGTFLRGPNWNFFGLYENHDPHKVVQLNNVNLSEYVWIIGLEKSWVTPGEEPGLLQILARESPGILLVLLYFIALPPLLARTVLRKFFLKMGFVRFFILVTLLLFMASLPIKMVLRWVINLKYIVAIPEYFFNI